MKDGLRAALQQSVGSDAGLQQRMLRELLRDFRSDDARGPG